MAGRRPLAQGEDSVPVHVKLPSSLYDDTRTRAREERVSVQEIIRRDVRQRTDAEKGSTLAARRIKDRV